MSWGRHIWMCVAVGCITVGGCSQKSNRGIVAGNVTLDGQPLKMGIIRFEPADGRTSTADGRIVDGKFSVSVPPGDKRVSISAQKVVGQKRADGTPTSPMQDIVEELVPEKYRTKSELTYTVQAGSQQKDFELKSVN